MLTTSPSLDRTKRKKECQSVWRQPVWCQPVRRQAVWCQCVCGVNQMSSCVMSICVMSICVMSSCVMSTCVMSSCVMSSCATSIFVMSICVMSSWLCVVWICAASVCVMSICVMSICVMSIGVRSYPERNLHTASRQTRMPARHPHKIFASPFGAATPNAIYTQQGAKPACQQDIRTKFSHLLFAELPRTQFTHSKAPNPHASKASTQNFRISYRHTAAKPACQEHINAKFSQLLLAQLPQTQFTHSTPPNPHASRTSSPASASSREHQSVHQTTCNAASPAPAT